LCRHMESKHVYPTLPSHRCPSCPPGLSSLLSFPEVPPAQVPAIHAPTYGVPGTQRPHPSSPHLQAVACTSYPARTVPPFPPPGPASSPLPWPPLSSPHLSKRSPGGSPHPPRRPPPRPPPGLEAPRHPALPACGGGGSPRSRAKRARPAPRTPRVPRAAPCSHRPLSACCCPHTPCPQPTQPSLPPSLPAGTPPHPSLPPLQSLRLPPPHPLPSLPCPSNQKLSPTLSPSLASYPSTAPYSLPFYSHPSPTLLPLGYTFRTPTFPVAPCPHTLPPSPPLPRGLLSPTSVPPATASDPIFDTRPYGGTASCFPRSSSDPRQGVYYYYQ